MASHAGGSGRGVSRTIEDVTLATQVQDGVLKKYPGMQAEWEMYTAMPGGRTDPDNWIIQSAIRGAMAVDGSLAAFKPDRVIVVTADPLLLPLMRGQGLHAVEDSGGGLNAALDLACRHAAARGARAIAVLPSDLPSITADDVRVLVANLKPAKLMGIESQGMVLAAGDSEVRGLATILEEVDPGTKVK
jgi:hypothetical protein